MSSWKLVTDVLSSDVKQVPSHYVANLYEDPNLPEVEVFQGSIPLIDLAGVQGPQRSQIIRQIGEACQEHGFFVVKNHGIPKPVIKSAFDVAKEFFKLPASERMQFYAGGIRKNGSLTSGFNTKTQKISHWKDTMTLHCYPLQDHVQEWPSNPPSFRTCMGDYCTYVRGLALTLIEVISESLGLEKDYINEALNNQGQNRASDYYFNGVNLNYYPPCPRPELVCGSPGHTDPSVITVLLPDSVPGLQILKNGKWMAINPIPNTFIINIGDMMLVLSNDKYKSARHRAVVNSEKERLSIASFFMPAPAAIVGPAKELQDDDHPAVYENFDFRQFFVKVSESEMASKCPLDLLKRRAA